ncbi:class I SAM-dependent methyltransferase [Pelagicoccus sp. SDUM812005]|uniref:class I SAM-dependent methyltransferase n=1 Tax=Pelagicoccus sp. SDUM812005 TaxID=3041257 RepID=UPI0028108417|nr:class I SAM-dependent methyltransferase [Pelagicoccus sp. SDUM812005]MDQ8180443.1 class I SAM-dependent methyltransferase [Pelagicoccus sp. SDUM812005]
MNGLRNVSSSWNSMAQQNAMEAVLTGAEWDERKFYASGEHEVNDILKLVNSQAGDLKTGEALDFGCGLGRLSFALCQHFEKVTGIDISKEMIEQATQSSRKPSNLQLTRSERNDLQGFEDNAFDFVLSLIVLQHIPQKVAKNYIREFLRVARPGGVIVFQAISKATGLKESTKQKFWADKPLNWDNPSLPKLIYRASFRFMRWVPRKILNHKLRYFLKKIAGKPVMQMNPIPRRSIEKAIRKSGGTLLYSAEDGRAGPDFESILFLVRKS